MRDVDPLSKKKIEGHYEGFKKGGTSNNVICCVLADIYHHSNDERIRLQCRRALAMAKAMSKKLEYYKSRG